ncbi:MULTISPECIES: adenylate/guanylate cyclase domain-containing protein [Prochlorococcus]|uniref:adenylate/guanylate cyclase domain-containing protein n=2 Tax=Prochlorococcaceae TaxID=2881426 RepID=UPI0007B3A6B5|nr:MULTISPECIES: adenylate/guanylate cyclase domain-containing protein [Prochlorococcus]KZR64712.1 Adenylate cyclase 1 [Prochlorococcus marinus str. MIT 1312]KZR79277.1 Adenylate cyclase 1 [Prochlorococcus marinus str. MIT 1327]
MRRMPHPRFWWWGLALVLPILIGMPALRQYRPIAMLEQLDLEIQSLAMLLHGRKEPSNDPVIVAIDETSLAVDALLTPEEKSSSPLLQAMGPWPWPRSLQAELAAYVLERGARGVIFNIVFANPSAYGPKDDQQFLDRLAPWRDRITLAADFERNSNDGIEKRNLVLPPWPWPRIGLATLLLSDRGQVRAIPGSNWNERELRSFPGPHPTALAFVANGRPPTREPLGLPFGGPAGDWPTVPAWQLETQPDAVWKDRLVLIGTTAAAMGHHRETPFGPVSGVEVQAVAIAAVADSTGLLPLQAFWEIPLLIGWLTVAGLLLLRARSSRAVVLTTLLLIGLSLLLTGAIWLGFQRWLPQAAVLAGLVLGGGTKATQTWLQESRERNELRRVLERRVSPRLLQRILKEPDRFGTQLGGQHCRCVVLFTDLVGFTRLSSQLKPETLFNLLNAYFDGLAGAVLAENGLLDKFIGDSLMAEFGIPESRGDREEALAAIRAALAMQKSLARLNDQLTAEQRSTLSQGIGMHFGDLIAGNLGSSDRLEFTVIGATVNVASRLEGLTRRFKDYPILISGELFALVDDAVEVVDLGPQAVKGLPEPIKVFGLVRLIG